MAWSWVTSEALAVDADGVPLDLTIRSFNIVKAAETPHIDVRIEEMMVNPLTVLMQFLLLLQERLGYIKEFQLIGQLDCKLRKYFIEV